MRVIIFLFLIGSIVGCNSDVTQQLEPKGVALGVMNEIVVIADDELWESAVGDTFRYYFESSYPILPAPEPLFDLRQFTVQELEGQPLRKELRTYAILTDLSDEDSETTQMVKRDMGSERFNQALSSNEPGSSVGKDKWSRGQLLFYLFGNNRDNLAASIGSNFSAIASRIHKHDEKQLRSSIYLDRINEGLSIKLQKDFGIKIDVPGEYRVAVEDVDNKTMWLRKDTDEAIINLVFQKLDYTNASQFTKENIIDIRNQFGRTYVTSDLEDNVMIVNTDDLPVYEYARTVDGVYIKELRGTWEMTKDFVAGPFISYLINQESSKSLLFVDAFVLAPGKNKREVMMQLDYIIRNAEFGTIQ
ncbi:MAG: DUF4837 family protein [Saprospiraceae bacterium]|nr:DUF4837 family protein [Saprospiraceae bacterium]